MQQDSPMSVIHTDPVQNSGRASWWLPDKQAQTGFYCQAFLLASQAKATVGLPPAGALGFWRRCFRQQTHSEAVIHPLRRSFHFQACRLPTRWRGRHVPISAPPPGQSGMLCARYGLRRKGNPQRKPLLSCSLLSSSTEACLSRFPHSRARPGRWG